MIRVLNILSGRLLVEKNKKMTINGGYTGCLLFSCKIQLILRNNYYLLE